MHRATDNLQMLQYSQDGSQEFQYFRLRIVLQGFLVKLNRLDRSDQPYTVRKLVTDNQHGMMDECFKVVLAHGSSPILAMGIPDQDSVVKVQVFAV